MVKNNFLKMRVTDGEYRIFKLLAESEGNTISNFVISSALSKCLPLVEKNTQAFNLIKKVSAIREKEKTKSENKVLAFDLHLFSNATTTIYKLLLKNGYLTGKINYSIARKYVERVNKVYQLLDENSQLILKKEYKEFQNFKNKNYVEHFMTKSGSFKLLIHYAEAKDGRTKLQNGSNKRNN